MFNRLSSYKIDEQLKALIVEHLQSMEYEFQHYFPELKKKLFLHETRSPLL